MWGSRGLGGANSLRVIGLRQLTVEGMEYDLLMF